MSLVMDSREVGSFKEQGSKAVAAAAAAAAAAVLANVPVYLHGGEGDVGGKGDEEAAVAGGRNGFCLGRRAFREVDAGGDSSESSSIGVAGESSVSLSSLSSAVADDRGDGEEEVQSKLRDDSFGSLASLKESLPVKRGLSNFFNGKSKSFASLSEAATAATSASDLAKPENPFNKRRRILMSAKASWRRRASCSSLSTAFSTPTMLPPSTLHALEESDDDDDDKSENEEEELEASEREAASALPPLPPLHRRLSSFRSPRSFSLSDLQQHA